jgi:hypothetical protein
MLLVVNWTFLASRARALPCIAHDPEVRVRDFAASRASPMRSANSTVTGPAEVGYEVKRIRLAAAGDACQDGQDHPGRWC